MLLKSPVVGSATRRRCVSCGAITRQRQLSWGKVEKEAAVTSGKRIRRGEVKKETNTQTEALTLDYGDICDGVAWYKIMVYNRKEEAVADDLRDQLSELPAVDGSPRRKGRYVSTWAPMKQELVINKRSKKLNKRLVKFGEMNGEIIFVACQMDEQAYFTINQHPYVQRFAHTHPVHSALPLPCPDRELLDVFDWLWSTETSDVIQENLNEVVAERLQPATDIAFEVDRLVNVHDADKGIVTTIDLDSQTANEYGPEWKFKQRRLERRQLAEERRQKSLKEDRTDKRVTKGRWRAKNPAQEREKAEDMRDFATTSWFEGSTDEVKLTKDKNRESLFDVWSEDTGMETDKTESEDFDTQLSLQLQEIMEEEVQQTDPPSKDSSTVGKEVVVLTGPYAEYGGVILAEKSDEIVSVKVDVFGKEATVDLAKNAVEILDMESDEDASVL